MHAVSVGEALAARPLLRALRAAYPEHRLVVSTTTATGQRVARGFGRDADAVCYAPFDFPWFVNRALDRVAPDLLLVVDTEIWPNLLRACRRRGVGSLIVNGRLSARSFRRYRLVRGCMRRVLADVGRICAQTEEWAQRFVAIGADPARVVVTGSLKFDAVGGAPAVAGSAAGADDSLRAAFAFARSQPVLIAASTLRGEEEPVLRAFGCVRQAAPDALLVIAPRHPERFEEARGIAGRAGYRARMRSELGAGGDPGADVVILNTLGRARTAVRDRVGGVRRREPRTGRRSQSDRAGGPSAGRSSSARTWRTSPTWPASSWRTAPRSRWAARTHSRRRSSA